MFGSVGAEDQNKQNSWIQAHCLAVNDAHKFDLTLSFFSSSGIVSLISLAVLSYERYCTMMAPTMASGREYRPALIGICFSWIYSVVWTVPPLLGWSKYGPEGPGTTCSVDWKTRTPNNISYIICLFTFCLVLPFCVILYSYGMLLHTIRQVRKT